MTTRPVRSGVTARVLDVLGAFSAKDPVLGLTDIARRTGLPLTTVHRIAGELAAGGALDRGDDGRYRIGLRLWEIAHLAPASHGLREAAMPFLEDLHEVTRHNVQLAVLDPDDAGEVVYVERLSSRDAVSIVTRTGSRLPSTATGVGLVLLAHADPAAVEAVLARAIALVFVVCGALGVVLTLAALASRPYRRLSAAYATAPTGSVTPAAEAAVAVTTTPVPGPATAARLPAEPDTATRR